MAEFSPVQLDALEDALEELELSGVPPELDDDLAVTGRLGEYKELLQLSREALPVVDVPDGILASVIAEAHAAPAAVEPAETTPEARPWWKRLGVWIPMLAVGASAALMLVMVRGTLSTEEAPATVASAKDGAKLDAAAPPRAPGPLLDQPEALQAAAESAKEADEVRQEALEGEARGRLRGASADGSAIGDAAGGGAPAEVVADEEARPEPEPEPEAAAEPSDKVVYDDAPAPKKKSSKGKPAPQPPKKPSKKSSGGKKNSAPLPGDGLPGGVPSSTLPTAPEGQKDDRASTDPSSLLSSADANRRAGRCTTARRQYRDLTDVADASVRARALAGLGLCALADGDEKAAESFFGRARKADAGVSSYIEAQRASASPPKKKTKKKK